VVGRVDDSVLPERKTIFKNGSMFKVDNDKEGDNEEKGESEG